MSEAVVEELEYGDILGHIYYLKKKNDLIPMHNHNENSIHLTIVAKGSIKHKTLEETTEHETGAILMLQDDNIMHEIRALEDNTIVINILKYSRDRLCQEKQNAIVI